MNELSERDPKGKRGDRNALPAPDPPLLEVAGLCLHYPQGGGQAPVRAVDGLELRIGPGETLGLVGESGCGKSSAARAIAQLVRPTAGQVRFQGRELTGLAGRALIAARQGMQMVFQDPYAALDPRMTAGELIAEPLHIYRNRGLLTLSRTGLAERVAELMEQVGLPRALRDRYPHQFSGGQRQRIGIARALAPRPEVLLCDEPVSALDVSIQAQILNLFKDLQQAFGLAYLFIAHDLAVVQYVASRVAVMYLGRLAETAAAADLYRDPLHPYTRALLSAVPIPDPQVERRRQRILLSGEPPSPDQLLAGCPFHSRCAQRLEVCARHTPRLREAAPGHQVACFLYHPPEG
jgi:oligopeptide transport system ATP-binding protein